MPIREFRCPAGHVTEHVLFGESDRTITSVACVERRCRHLAQRVDFSRTVIFSEDFHTVKNYEKRKGPSPLERGIQT